MHHKSTRGALQGRLTVFHTPGLESAPASTSHKNEVQGTNTLAARSYDFAVDVDVRLFPRGGLLLGGFSCTRFL